MGTIVHHQPVNKTASWRMHVSQPAWDGNNRWDFKATPNGDLVDFELPETPDLRKLQFQFHSNDRSTGQDNWEPDDFRRRLFLPSPREVWTFESTPRVLYQNPFPPGVAFQPGDVFEFQVLTQNVFRGGQLYAWNPYDSSAQPAYFPESARDDTNGISTFRVTLAHG